MDDDKSICADFFNADTVITPSLLTTATNDTTPMYNMLVKPHYPVNLQYVLDSERMMPIPAEVQAAYGAYSGKKKKAEETTMHTVIEDATECKIGQVIWGNIAVNTKVNGEAMRYEGTLYAVADFDTSSSMLMRRMTDMASTDKVVAEMCKDKGLRETVPFIWEFDLKRVK